MDRRALPLQPEPDLGRRLVPAFAPLPLHVVEQSYITPIELVPQSSYHIRSKQLRRKKHEPVPAPPDSSTGGPAAPPQSLLLPNLDIQIVDVEPAPPIIVLPREEKRKKVRPPTDYEETRVFSCPVVGCGKKYRFKGDLKVHLKKKHPEEAVTLGSSVSRARSSKDGKPYPCPVGNCPCGYVAMRDLHRHLRTKHPQLRLPPLTESSSTWTRDQVETAVRSAELEGDLGPLVAPVDPAVQCWHRSIIPLYDEADGVRLGEGPLILSDPDLLDERRPIEAQSSLPVEEQPISPGSNPNLDDDISY